MNIIDKARLIANMPLPQAQVNELLDTQVTVTLRDLLGGAQPQREVTQNQDFAFPPPQRPSEQPRPYGQSQFPQGVSWDVNPPQPINHPWHYSPGNSIHTEPYVLDHPRYHNETEPRHWSEQPKLFTPRDAIEECQVRGKIYTQLGGVSEEKINDALRSLTGRVILREPVVALFDALYIQLAKRFDHQPESPLWTIEKRHWHTLTQYIDLDSLLEPEKPEKGHFYSETLDDHKTEAHSDEEHASGQVDQGGAMASLFNADKVRVLPNSNGVKTHVLVKERLSEEETKAIKCHDAAMNFFQQYQVHPWCVHKVLVLIDALADNSSAAVAALSILDLNRMLAIKGVGAGTVDTLTEFKYYLLKNQATENNE